MDEGFNEARVLLKDLLLLNKIRVASGKSAVVMAAVAIF